MIGDIMQPTHLLFVLAIALLVLGPKRLPEVGRQLGKGLRDFRSAINGEHTDEIGGDTGHASDTRQAPAQPMEHQFAHQTTESVASHDQSTSGVSGEAADNGHQFGSYTAQPAESGPAEHQTDAGTPEQSADAGTSGTPGEHEFAYQPARPDEKPVDPLS